MRKIFSIVLFFIMIMAMQINVFAMATKFNSNINKEVSNSYVVPNALPESKSNVVTTGVLPKEVSNNSDVNKNINGRVSSFYDKVISSANLQRAKSVAFSYSVYSDGGYMSVVMVAEINGPVTTKKVESININTNLKKPFTYCDYLGVGDAATATVNSIINSEILNNPQRYNTNFAGVTADSNFYTKNGVVYLLLDSYVLIPSDSEIYQVAVNKSRFKTYLLQKEKYYIKGNFNVKMVPLRAVSEAFGYTVGWNNATQEIEVSRGGATVKLKVNNNAYVNKNGFTKKLEYAPEIVSGKTYVPISFFDEILGINYSVNAYQLLTFSEYTN